MNIPPKLNKEEVYKNLELINLQYNRLYKTGFYWNLSTTDKETVICVQNSLRTLTYDDMTPKYSLKNKTQILDLMKEQIIIGKIRKEILMRFHGGKEVREVGMILILAKRGIRKVIIIIIIIIKKGKDLIRIIIYQITREKIMKNINRILKI